MGKSAYAIHRLGSKDIELMHALLDTFGDAFNDIPTYSKFRPDHPYLERLLNKDDFFALAALSNGKVIGGLAAYELQKFEQARSEIYIYDLAVRAADRRRGVATALIDKLREIAARRDAWVIFVQADYGDAPAIALYQKLGVREEVLHFDIAVK
jgi:aminoglycoside 3-N-acetyltransferase I